MTKKSSARLARDAEKARTEKQFKENVCYDDLNKIHQDCVQLLLSHGHLYAYSKSKELIAAVVNKDELVQNIKLLSSDLAQMNKELAEIHTTHAGKSGGTQDPDAFVQTYPIYEQYNLFMERHNAVIMPTANHISEQFAEAEKRLAGALQIVKAEEGLSDPAVVSDVEFKEVPKERQMVHVQLDENDPTPQKTVEAVMGSTTSPQE